jgi:HPt (histidine-containing phosphotransfer) domain-containing protein
MDHTPETNRPTIDWRKAREAVGGDGELLRELAEVFLSDATRLMDALKDALIREDAAAVKLSAHALKGSVRIFATARLYDWAWEIEQRADQGHLDPATGKLADLQEHFDLLRQELRAFLERGH